MKKSMLSFWLVAIALFIGSPIFAQSDSFDLKAAIPFDSKVIKGKLDNGLTYYIRQNEKPKNIVELRLVVNAGSILEDDDQQGLAHFTEHMCFNGTKHFEKNDLVSYLQSIGVEFGNDLNAYTGFDQTVYMIPVPGDNEAVLDSGLLVIRDWAGDVTFEGEEIDKERGVILEELRLGRGAQQRMRDKYFPMLFKGSKYAERLPIGKKELLETFKHETLRRFYHEWYRPDLMAVIVVGDMNPDIMLKKIEKLFGDLKAPEKYRERKDFPVPDHQETYVKVVSDKEAPYTVVQIMYLDDVKKTVTWNDYKRAITENMFSGMMNKRLSELTKEAEPPFMYAYSGYGGLVRTKNAYMSIGIVGASGIDKALKALITENQRVKKYGFTQTELDRYKSEYLKRLEKQFNEQGKTESKRYVGEYINNFLEDEPSPGIKAEYEFAKEILPQITIEDVNSLATGWIKDYNRMVVVAAPEKEGVVLPTEEEVLSWLNNVEKQEVKPYVDQVSNRPLMENIPPAAKIVSKKVFEKTGITEYTFENGLKVVVKPTQFKNDEVLFSASAKGGTSIFNDNEFRSAGYADDLVTESGVNKFTKIELEKLLADKNVRVSPNISTISQGFYGNSTPEDFETALQLINLYFTAPNFSQKSFRSVINKQKMIMASLMEDPVTYYRDQVNRILSNNHPRGNYMPTVEELDNLNFTIAKKAYKKLFDNPGDFTFFFTGNLNMDTVLPLLQKYLGSIPAADDSKQFVDLGIRPPSGPVKKTIYKGQDAKSRVNIYFRGATKFNPEENYLIASLGEVLTIKLIENLREKKSGVYGVGAYGYESKYPYGKFGFTVSFPCGPENVDELTKAANAEIEKIKKEGPAEKDVEKVKKTQLVNNKTNLETNRYWLNSMSDAWWTGENPDEILKKEETINNLNKKALKKVANKYLKDKYRIEIVLMPEKK
jgi:zinc protease